MHRVQLRLFTLFLAILAAPVAALPAQEVTPATVAEAARVLDLETFPLMKGGVSRGPRRLANLSYAARSDVRGAYDFQKKTLEGLGWKEQPGSSLTDQSCSGAFAKNGFTVSVSVSPAFGPDSEGLVEIYLTNHGNIGAAKLPVPPGAKLLYSFPATTAYVTAEPAKETGEAMARLLMAQGWEPYGDAGDSRFFKKNAVQLSVFSSVAPGQGGKTVIQLATTLMSADLPAPPAITRAQYADTTKALNLDTKIKPDAVVAFYKDALGKNGWKATTDHPIKEQFKEILHFTNPAKDLITLETHTTEGITRANIEHRTAAEVARAIELAQAAEAKRKAKVEQDRLKMEAARPAKITVAITVPTNATNVVRTKDNLTFKVPAGKATAAVGTIGNALKKAGWKEDTAALEPQAGAVVLSKKPGVSVAIHYIDIGVGAAEITITTFGAEIQGAK